MADWNDTGSMDFDQFVTPWRERVSCAIVFSTFSGLGVITNGIAILLTICTDLRKRKVNAMIGNLALSGFLESGIFLSGQNFYILYREMMPPIGCSWLGFLNFITSIEEYVWPPVLAINRYIGLYRADAYDRIFTPIKITLMTVTSWVASGIIPAVFALTGHTLYDRRNEHCCIVVEGDVLWTVLYWVIIVVPLVGLCDTTMIFCNWKIYKKLKDHDNTQGAVLKNNVIRENKEILYFMIIDMLIPICVHTVYHICKFVVTNRLPLFSRQLFTSLYLGNTVVRGILILVMLRPYREAFKQHILGRKPNTIMPSESAPTKSRVAAISKQ